MARPWPIGLVLWGLLTPLAHADGPVTVVAGSTFDMDVDTGLLSCNRGLASDTHTVSIVSVDLLKPDGTVVPNGVTYTATPASLSFQAGVQPLTQPIHGPSWHWHLAISPQAASGQGELIRVIANSVFSSSVPGQACVDWVTETFFGVNVMQPSILITSADLSHNNFNVNVANVSSMGRVTLALKGSQNEVFARSRLVNQGAVPLGFSRPQIPADTYTSLQASWSGQAWSFDWPQGPDRTPSDVTVTTPAQVFFSPVLTLPNPWVVEGVLRYSQYNTPYESACSGASTPAWVVDGSCHFTAVSLNRQFLSQVVINGTGVSLNQGILKYIGSACPARSFPAGATKANSLLYVSAVTGACNQTLTGGSSTARYPNPAVNGSCEDTFAAINAADTSTLSMSTDDYCPACSGDFRGTNGHIDAYSSAQACVPGALADLGNFWTLDTD